MEGNEQNITITITVVAYNEEKYLSGLLYDIREQTYPHEKIEVLLIDSMSEDGTRQIMNEFSENFSEEFLGIRILENKEKILCYGWNTAIRNFSADVLVRVDAHARIPCDFIEKNISQLRTGEMVVGGARPTRSESDDVWSRTLLMVEDSLFGSSISDFRRKREKSYVKSIFHGAYRREVFDKVGGFNENLGRTEDNEFHYRVRKAGYRIALSPDIVSYQYIRPTFRKMLKQKFGNGYWIGLTLGVCPGCLSIYYFAPFVFVLGILFTTGLALFGYPQLGFLMWSLYALLAVGMTGVSMAAEKKKGNRLGIPMIALPVLFLLLHVSYGVGTIAGLCRLPFWPHFYRENKSTVLYLFFGACTTAVNLGISALLWYVFGWQKVKWQTPFGVFSAGTFFGNAISVFLAIVFAYVTNKKYVFESRTHGSRERLAEFARFLGGRISTMIIELGGVQLAVLLWPDNGTWLFIAKLITQVLVIVINYFISKFLVFRGKNYKNT